MSSEKIKRRIKP
jgi:hypothetical protein